MNMGRFQSRFDWHYKRFYESEDRVPGFDEAVRKFDRMMEVDWFKTFAREFCGYRRDVMLGDRECAAFVFAMVDFGMIEMRGYQSVHPWQKRLGRLGTGRFCRV